MAWILLFVAGLFEVVWAYFMKQSAAFTRLGPTVAMLLGMVASVGLLSLSMRTLPLGIAALGSRRARCVSPPLP
jgi:quaternary ammonium compound-resistance protein SugE